MNEILQTREILGTVALPGGECELVASAAAEYHEAEGRMLVTLRASLEPRQAHGKANRAIVAEWLPKNQTVSESVSIDEAGEAAREIFRRWARKVREAAPGLHRPSFI